MAFKKRGIDVKFVLNRTSEPTTFAASGNGSNVVTLTGLRVTANIRQAAPPDGTRASLRIFGVSLSVMNDLSSLGKSKYQENYSTHITVSAGNAGAAKPVVFVGNVSQAWVDGGSQPDVALVVQAFTGLVDNVKPLPPTSFPGPANVADIISGLAVQMGYTFENNGVSVILNDQYLPGTGRAQVQRAADAAGIRWDVIDNVLSIWPRGGSRNSDIPLVGPTSGMVGYPSYTQDGCMIVSTYNPAIRRGGQIKVESSFTPAQGVWPVTLVEHDLESETPGGAWMTRASCSFFGSPAPFTPGV